MGMLIDGKWNANATQAPDGSYGPPLPHWSSLITSKNLDLLPDRYVLVASYSCPWSHATLIARSVLGLRNVVPLHVAGGPRIEGYGLAEIGPLNTLSKDAAGTPVYRHIHQLYTATAPKYSGRATVPVLWDSEQKQLVLTDSTDILLWLDNLPDRPKCRLHPETGRDETHRLLRLLREDLSMPIYRAGLANTQAIYDQAVETVFSTLADLEAILATRRFLLGSTLSVCDIRLFCILLRFDTVYGPLFRCTRKRLTDHSALWAYTRDILAWPGVRETIDMQTILEGYYLNDGETNPHRIVAEAPELDWASDGSRSSVGDTFFQSHSEINQRLFRQQNGVGSPDV